MAKPKNDPNKPLTMKDLDEFVQAILAGTEELFNELSREMIAGFQRVDKRFRGIDHSLKKLEVGQSHLKDQIDGLKADLSDTPSRREFQQLKSKVDRHHPGPG